MSTGQEGGSPVGRRPRGTCPHCGRDTALTTRGLTGPHHKHPGDLTPGSYNRCPGVGRPPADTPNAETLLARLVEMTATLDAAIDRRAAQIAAARSAETLRLVLPTDLRADAVVSGIADAVSQVGDTLADLYAQYDGAARQARSQGDELASALCAGQARAYRAAAGHLAEGVSEAFGLWHQHQDQTGPDGDRGDGQGEAGRA